MKKLIQKITILSLLLFTFSWVSAQGDAELELRTTGTSFTQNQEFKVDVILKNPGREAVISVRSWLSYDPSLLQATSIDSGSSLFTLSAPGEDNISAGEGRVKIGRSNISGGVKEFETVVVSVNFKVLAPVATTSSISFYDYQISELGHTSVNIIDAGFPLNILSSEPRALSLQLNPGVSAPAPAPVPTPTPTPVPTGPIGGSGFNSSLIRPVNLRVNTGNGYVDLKWDASADPDRTGFNIYYGSASNNYTRRRSIGNFDNYRLDGLTNGQTYYLAVTAYDRFNQESDYSNEVGIIINEPLSSTNPFASFLSQVIGQIPAQPQNGPLAWWILISAMGLSASVVFRKKKTVKTGLILSQLQT